MTSLSRISFNGSLLGVGTTCGYGYAAVQLIEAWQRQNVAVWWADKLAPVAFSMSQPEFYEWQSDDQLKIGYTPWESTKLPNDWRFKMNQMDEIWTTSEACKRWFAKNGVTRKIRVLHHGINREHFPLKMRKLHDGESYRFLHIGSETPRKGALMAYEAFKECFGEDTKYQLILKGKPNFETTGSNIIVIEKYLTQQELTELYLQCHAMIYPTNGEGFGLIPFQAAATGMPTLVTNWGGCQEFIEYCWPINFRKEVPCNYFPHVGHWAEPCFEDIVLWMEYFADSPEYFFHKAFSHGNKMTEHYSWDFLAKISLEWIQESLIAMGH